MAKKKKSQRKRNFTYSANNKPASKAPVASAAVGTPQEEPARTATPAAPKVAVTDHKQHVRYDIQTILWLALGCILLELVLWFLLQHTGLGHTVFGS